MRRTLLCGLAAATFVTITSWSDMAKRAAAKQSGVDIHRSASVATLPVAPMQDYEAY